MRLDLDGDNRLDAADPAFAALRLWADANAMAWSRTATPPSSPSTNMTSTAIQAHVHGGEANPDARPASPPTPPRTSIPIAPFAFVPAAAATPARAVREVTREMIASADGGLFGAGHRGSATLGGPEVSRFQQIHKHIRRTTTTS